ncbi:MAG: hypothetical protein M3R17_07035 [Bacteroidota bacterium]|nr:hypothetical protein [Bacteroidota bacterium]
MKTVILSLSFLLCFSGIPVCAQTNFTADPYAATAAQNKTQSQIFAKIIQHMHVPESMKNTVSSERVRVVFTIDENGKAHVVDVCTGRPELKSSVTGQFEAIDFSDSKDTAGEMFSIWLTFKVL